MEALHDLIRRTKGSIEGIGQTLHTSPITVDAAQKESSWFVALYEHCALSTCIGGTKGMSPSRPATKSGSPRRLVRRISD